MKQKNLQDLVRTKTTQGSKVPEGVVRQEILQKKKLGIEVYEENETVTCVYARRCISWGCRR